MFLHNAHGMKHDREQLVESCICAKYSRVQCHVTKNLVTKGGADSDLSV